MQWRDCRTDWLRVATGLSLFLAACSVTTSEEPREGVCLPFELTSLSPPDGATNVSPDALFVYSFTDFPEPDTAISANFGVFSGPYYYTAHEAVDLVGRTVLFKPTSSLPSGLGFTLGMTTNVASLRGCPIVPPPALPSGKQPTSYYFSFHTAEPGTDVPPDPTAAPATFAQVLDVMAAHCAGAGCHLSSPAEGDTSGGCLDTPGGGVSLCAAQAYDDLVGITSRQVSRLAIVAPRDSARSYLLRKLLGAPPVSGHVAPPADVLTEADLRTIESWIDSGAAPLSPTP
jgi:hypothetical protein